MISIYTHDDWRSAFLRHSLSAHFHRSKRRGLTGTTIEDEIPHSGPGETSVPAWETAEPVFEQVGAGADCP